MDYFSDRENGPRARTSDDVSPQAWGGLVALVQGSLKSGAFALRFPESCPDGMGPIGTDETSFELSVKAEIQELNWPLQTTEDEIDGFSVHRVPFAPQAHVVMDFVEFCFRAIAKPVQGSYHKFFQHHHLSFEEGAGKQEFQEAVNRIFARNGLAYRLTPNGKVERLAPTILRESLVSRVFSTGDIQLDKMLEEARRKFLSPDLAERRVALERLWDCWERIKSAENPSNKKVSVEMLLAKVAPEAEFRAALDREAKELTTIGNSFHIRHSEVTQQPLKESRHVDYLFHRLFSLITLLLRE